MVEVTATNAAGDDVATSAPGASVAVDPPATSGTPAAAGTPVDGQTLTADPGAWTGTGPIDFTYQWQRCDAAGANCVDIAGATDATYTLGSGDVGSTVRVIVTGDNGEQTSVPSHDGRPDRRRAAGLRHRAGDLRHRRRRPHADRGRRHLGRHAPARLHVPVAALRRRRLQLRRHQPAPPTAPTT